MGLALASLSQKQPQEDLEANAATPSGRADVHRHKLVIEMTRNMSVALYIMVLIAVVVSVDVLFFRNRLWERLIVNIGIVLVFAAFYLRFMQNP
jgi:hypothetical protein